MKLTSKLTVFLLLSFFGTTVSAQDVTIKSSKFNSELNNQKKSQSDSFFKQATTSILLPHHTLAGKGYENPERNFNPSSSASLSLKYAGDINGDGKDDFYYNVNTPDETTNALEDRINKTVVLYGSTTGVGNDNSILIRGNYNFISDLTGDGQPESIQNIDGTLYIVEDESNGSMNELNKEEFLTISHSFDYSSQGDFDGDGYNDLFVYGTEINPSEPRENYLIYGASTLDNISIDTLIFSAQENAKNAEFNKIAYSDLDNDGKTELIQAVSGLDINDDGYGLVNLYHINSSGELELIKQKSVSDHINLPWAMRSGTLKAFDLLKGDNKEIILYGASETSILTYTSEGELLSELFTPILGPNLEGFTMLNDFNGDGIDELMYIASNEALLTTYSFSEVYLRRESLPLQAEEQISPPNNYMQNATSGSDVDGDGFNDIVVGFSNSETDIQGYRVYFGNTDFSFDDSKETKIEKVEKRNIYFVSNVGDLNADGIPDYAFSYETKDNSLLGISDIHIFFGGPFESATEPNLIFESETLYHAPRHGDFNGDGISDLIVTQLASAEHQNDAKIEIYFGSSLMDTVPDHTIYSSEVYPEGTDITSIGVINGIGDINNDGFDDIAFASRDELETTKIIFGGSSISKTPDLELPYFSADFISVGDFNEDGVDDFATSKLLEDLIFIHLGYDEASGESFNSDPYLIFTFPEQNATNGVSETKYLGYFMVAGDFDGDGVNDLAANSMLSSNTSSGSDNSEVGASVFVFKGGSMTDSLVDAEIPVLAKYFANSTSQLTENEKSLYLAYGALATVEDLNGDGADELLFATSFYAKNAGVFYGGDLDTMGNSLGFLLEGPNSDLGLGPTTIYSTSVYKGYLAVGDFSGDNNIDFILPQAGDYNFRVDPVYVYSYDGKFVDSEDEPSAVLDFKLHQNYPNPFNPNTKISYELPKGGEVKLEVFDISGRLVATVVNERQIAGSYTQNFDASGLASGVYFYRLETVAYTHTRKMLLIK